MNWEELLSFSYICKKGIMFLLETSLRLIPPLKYWIHLHRNKLSYFCPLNQETMQARKKRKGVKSPQLKRDLSQGKGHFSERPTSFLNRFTLKWTLNGLRDPILHQSTCVWSNKHQASLLPFTIKGEKANPQAPQSDKLHLSPSHMCLQDCTWFGGFISVKYFRPQLKPLLLGFGSKYW